jgi:hypothetical protein
VDNLPESTNSPASLTSEPEKLLPVIQADEQAALAMLEHAFRNVSPRALKDVSFGDISQAFARHRGDRETGEPCEACGKPVEVGQVVLCYDDAGEMHADCERPFALDYTREDDQPEPVVLLGSPMRHITLSRLSSPVSGTDGPILPGVTLVKREADKECGCPEEEWETPWGYLFMHLNAGKPSDAALDNADAGEWETTITAPTVNAARAAIFGWAATVAEQRPVEGSAIGRALREVPDERFREIVDSLDVGRARSLICEMMVDLGAHLSAAPTPPIPMIAEAGEREAAAFRLVRGGANSHCFDDRLVVGDEAIGFVDEDWSDRLIAALSTPATLDNTAVEALRAAAREVLKYRVGEQPTRGYLRDNDRSRTALTALAATLTAKTEKAE